ncbi:hypothetical protein PGTUg99_026272 [Puccinia graminis f. sp. tritici]|uniref:Uncharacterized protein n=1 Tax=Puccinia graminis f. sp. tritici TaxID=56615 RepID=A0A5B0MGT4_PUCGR|nr:hypothetical protein PGTUg99_026272 [Puccinia graminis f. sp. tritici]
MCMVRPVRSPTLSPVALSARHGHKLSPQLGQQLPDVPAKLQVEPSMEKYPQYCDAPARNVT